MALTTRSKTALQRQVDEDLRLIERLDTLQFGLRVRVKATEKPLHNATRNALREVLRQAEIHEGVK